MGESMWPELDDLEQRLSGLTATPVVVPSAGQMRAPTDDDIDRIHEGLLRKQRAGSLGLNE